EGPPVRPRAAEGRVAHQYTLALWAYQRVRRRYTIYAVARGAYRLGPMTLRTTDPFGILQREADREEPGLLLVHPLVAPLEGFGLPPNAPFGERQAPRRLLEDPLRVAGGPAPTPGDAPRRAPPETAPPPTGPPSRGGRAPPRHHPTPPPRGRAPPRAPLA